jgi:hypothetical protein
VTLHTTNGFLLVQPLDEVSSSSGLIIIRDPSSKLQVMTGIILQLPDDRDDLTTDDYDFLPGDQVYFTEALDLNNNRLVHCQDIVAWESIRSKHEARTLS